MSPGMSREVPETVAVTSAILRRPEPEEEVRANRGSSVTKVVGVIAVVIVDVQVSELDGRRSSELELGRLLIEEEADLRVLAGEESQPQPPGKCILGLNGIECSHAGHGQATVCLHAVAERPSSSGADLDPRVLGRRLRRCQNYDRHQPRRLPPHDSSFAAWPIRIPTVCAQTTRVARAVISSTSSKPPRP